MDEDMHSETPGVETKEQDEEQKGEDDLDIEEKVGGEEAKKKEAEFNALCNLADSLPDISSDEEDLAMETDPRYLISHSLMKSLLDTSLNLDGHMEVYSEEEEGEVQMAEHDDDRVDQGEEVAGAAPGQEDDVALCIPGKGNICFSKYKEYFDRRDESTKGQIGNLDDQRHWSSEDEDEDIHSEVATEVGAVDAESGKQVSGGIFNNVRSDGELGTGSAKGPDPPYPPDTPSDSDYDKEDAGYGSGADGTVLKLERAVTWFPPLTGGRPQKRNSQSRFGPGFQGDPSTVTNFTKRRKVQAIESVILDSASLLRFASLTQPFSQAHVLLSPGAAGEDKCETELPGAMDENERKLLGPECTAGCSAAVQHAAGSQLESTTADCGPGRSPATHSAYACAADVTADRAVSSRPKLLVEVGVVCLEEA